MKTTFNNASLVSTFASQVQEYGKNANGSMYFEGDTIFSYGTHFPIARIVGKFAMITTRRNSVTTANHISLTYAALANDYVVIPVDDISDDTTEAFDSNVAAINDEIAALHDRHSRARTRKDAIADAITARETDLRRYIGLADWITTTARLAA